MAIDKGTNDANDIKIDMGDAGALNFAGNIINHPAYLFYLIDYSA